MSDIFSAAKIIKLVKETSELLFMPATIAAVYAEFAADLSGYFELGKFSTFILCAIIGFFGAIGLYQILIELHIRVKATSIFAVFSSLFVAAGLLTLANDQLSFKFLSLTQFTGLALLFWGVMLFAVEEKKNKDV